jgi:aldehyde:ferredoxin oxidoreductase
MGAKRLKAVVLAGARPVAVHDRQRIRQLSRRFADDTLAYQPDFLSGSMIAFMGKLMRAMPTQLETDGLLYKFMLREWGTVSMNQAAIEMGDAPIRNWSGSHEDFGSEQSAPIDPDEITRTPRPSTSAIPARWAAGG